MEKDRVAEKVVGDVIRRYAYSRICTSQLTVSVNDNNYLLAAWTGLLECAKDINCNTFERAISGKQLSWSWCENFAPIWGHSWQCWTVLYTSVDIFDQTCSHMSVSYIRRSAGRPVRAEWGTWCNIIEHNKFGTTFCMVPSIGDRVSNSPLLLK